MSGHSQRDALFLQEMGLGPLWTLRSAEGQAALEEAPAAAPSVGAVQSPDAARPVTGVAMPATGAVAPAGRAVAGGAAMPAAAAPTAFGGAMPSAPAAAAAEAGAVNEEAIAAMDWPALRSAVASCTRCGLCRAGARPLMGAGPARAQWLVAAGAVGAADESAGTPLAGDAGRLLDNMLGAAGLARGEQVYVTHLIKCRPTTAAGADRAPTADEAAACRPYLERELALTGAGLVVTLGQIAANALLGKPLSEPLSGSRGKVHRLGATPLVATLHPGELLLRGKDKALAWADLCLARSADEPAD